MDWLALNVEQHHELLVEHFPVEVEDGRGWKRGIDLSMHHERDRSRAWVEVSTGNLLLIDWVGAELGHIGRVHAWLWIAATGLLVSLVDRSASFYGDDHVQEYQARSEALAAAGAAIRGRFDLGVPSAPVDPR